MDRRVGEKARKFSAGAGKYISSANFALLLEYARADNERTDLIFSADRHEIRSVSVRKSVWKSK